jgi:hypothetical protein
MKVRQTVQFLKVHNILFRNNWNQRCQPSSFGMDNPVFETSVQFWKFPKTGHFLKNFYEFYGV